MALALNICNNTFPLVNLSFHFSQLIPVILNTFTTSLRNVLAISWGLFKILEQDAPKRCTMNIYNYSM